VLFELEKSHPESSQLGPIRLRHFEYEPQLSATVLDIGTLKPQTSNFLVLRCREADADLQAQFLELVEGLVEYLGEQPSPNEVDEAVRDLVELFRSMSGPSRRTISGLWAELLVLLDAADCEIAGAAWHSDPNEQHDFVVGNEQVEVKSTTAAVREHEVTLSQLSVPTGGIGFMVSVMLEPHDAGASTNDLLAEALTRLSARGEQRRRLRAIVAATIGEDWREADQVRFNISRARSSRLVYDMSAIPTVDPRVPPQVSSVRFVVDLSDTVSLEPDVAARRGVLPAALFGRWSHAV